MVLPSFSILYFLTQSSGRKKVRVIVRQSIDNYRISMDWFCHSLLDKSDKTYLMSWKSYSLLQPGRSTGLDI